ncbi:MFS transporter [Terrilactibacillus laevilacticus]|uniref:MFS transporter n=1 Tax=Terrilactibacillus laevilacticus TaxID=1380157 RepID=UPI00114654BB|nr:MFS transporter [Terrilactibacillus laevilacticus]
MGSDYSYQSKSIWQYKEFTLLLSASLLLSIGNKIYELLLPLIMYDQSGGSAIVMTSMRTAELLPNLFFGIFIGVIVDRVNKKTWANMMILSQAIVLLGVYLMFGTGVYKPMIFYLAGFILMTLNYGFFNTQVSLIKLSVPLNMLTSANAKFSFVDTFVNIMGPVFLGIVLSFLSMTQGILVTILLYMTAFLLIKYLSISEIQKVASKKSFWSDFKEGWFAFKDNQYLRTMTIYVILVNSTMSVVSTTILFFGIENLGLSNSSLSIILSIAGVGGLVASLTINELRKRMKLGVLFGIAIFLNAVAYIGLYLTNHLLLFAVSLFVLGYATTIYIISAYTFRHEQTPTHLMGRIGGITGTLFRIGMPITMLISGWIINFWGSSFVFLGAAIMNLLVFMSYWKTSLSKLK